MGPESRVVALPARAAAAFTAYRDGDPSGMEGLVEDLTPLLWQIARQQGLDRSGAEDAVQTAWLRLVGAADGIDDPAAILKWLLTTVRREAWRLTNLGRRDVPVTEEALAATSDALVSDGATSPTVAPGDLFETREERATVRRAFAALPLRCRELLAAVVFVDRPDYATVAVALGMPVGSIGPTRGRCLAKLRVLLENDPTWGCPS
ncbi:MAG TPA: sigma-70 family RNA polymerase sigma factor [Phycicoccus sp.]|nr:sigma-70 family RNA polymerase sigma factor [Phycicoccus sp.]